MRRKNYMYTFLNKFEAQTILYFSGLNADPLDLFLKVSSLLVIEVHIIDWQSVKESEAL